MFKIRYPEYFTGGTRVPLVAEAAVPAPKPTCPPPTVGAAPVMIRSGVVTLPVNVGEAIGAFRASAFSARVVSVAKAERSAATSARNTATPLEPFGVASTRLAAPDGDGPAGPVDPMAPVAPVNP